MPGIAQRGRSWTLVVPLNLLPDTQRGFRRIRVRRGVRVRRLLAVQRPVRGRPYHRTLPSYARAMRSPGLPTLMAFYCRSTLQKPSRSSPRTASANAHSPTAVLWMRGASVRPARPSSVNHVRSAACALLLRWLGCRAIPAVMATRMRRTEAEQQHCVDAWRWILCSVRQERVRLPDAAVLELHCALSTLLPELVPLPRRFPRRRCRCWGRRAWLEECR